MAALILGDPGRIDRQKTWLRVLTASLIGLITVVNVGSSLRLIVGIYHLNTFTNTRPRAADQRGDHLAHHVIAFGLWYWDLDRGGAAARAQGLAIPPAFVFPEMSNAEFVRRAGTRRSSTTSSCRSAPRWRSAPTDVSAIRPWSRG
jgi:hypothetical protein